MLDINTDSLKQMASIASSANTEIEQAVDLLNRITSHNDWCCPERYQINDGIQSCKRTAAAVKDSSDGFLRAITAVMDEFIEKESGIGRLFEGVEGIIKRTLAIVATGGSIVTGNIPTINTASSKILTGTKSLWKTIKETVSNVIKPKAASIDVLKVKENLSDPISTVNFEDLNL